MSGLSGQLGADGLLVACHAHAKEPTLMFSDGDCTHGSEVEQMLLACAVESLAQAGDRAETATSCRDRLTSTIVTATLVLRDVSITVTSLLRRSPKAELAAGRARLFGLLPIAWPFLKMWSQHQLQDRKLESLEAALDKSEIATLLLNEGGRVLFANRSGRTMLESGCGLRAERSVLTGPNLTDTLRLRAAVAHVCSQDRTEGAITPILALPRRHKRPLMITLEAVSASQDEEARTVVAHLFDPEDDLTALIEPACRFYGLSPSEARLTRSIAEGISLVDAAAAIGIREQTARSYLKQIFLKTETNRQAELVALMLRSAVRLSPHSRTQVF